MRPVSLFGELNASSYVTGSNDIEKYLLNSVLPNSYEQEPPSLNNTCYQPTNCGAQFGEHGSVGNMESWGSRWTTHCTPAMLQMHVSHLDFLFLTFSPRLDEQLLQPLPGSGHRPRLHALKVLVERWREGPHLPCIGRHSLSS